ncbi:MAG: NAD(P)-dependent oxidoreductase, partial [Chloroflexota bacterium]|nr:NAD(P)-dependent oxidoreductase [Chloroflexota bacterium]
FSSLPFADADLEELRTNPMGVVGRHWPDAPGLLARIGEKPWGPINTLYDSKRAAQELEWRPRFGFGTFLEGLRRGIRSEDGLTPEPGP